jgi:hypothetical protein
MNNEYFKKSLRKTTKVLQKVFGVAAEIRNESLSSITQKQYSLSHFFGKGKNGTVVCVDANENI